MDFGNLSPRSRTGPTVLPPTRKKLVTASIDFGTAYTGYSYCFHHKPLEIISNSWEYGGYTSKSCKAPSSVLLHSNGNFHSFGFAAEKTYETLTENDQHGEWRLFEKFKMKLYEPSRQQEQIHLDERNLNENKLTLDTTIADIDGNDFPAIVIFTMVIEHLKGRLVAVIQESQGDRFTNEDVFWILTVPAIWSDSAKQFMHIAANKAGIMSDQLRLVLEPEAASFYCQTKCTIKHGAGANVMLERFPPGYVYVILDLGGGTVDIATHEVLQNNDLREIFVASGGALGSCRIDEAFIEIMSELFGKNLIAKFKKEDRTNYRDMMSSFEEKKRSISLLGDSDMVIKLPFFFFEQLGKQKAIQKKVDSNKKLKGQISVIRDKLRFSSNVVKGFFKETVDQIVAKVEKIIRLHQVSAVLAVGGFSESPYVKESIKKALEGTQVKFLAPDDPGNHVMYGATLTNIFPNKINERISRYSYGFRLEEEYDEKVHAGHKSTDSRGTFCSIVYYECIPIGKRLKYNETFLFDKIGGRRDAAERRDETTPVEFWCSNKQETKFCLPEEGCKLVGVIDLIPPKDGWPDEVHFDIQLRVGEAEFCVTVTDKKSGRNFKTNVDFLR